MLRSSHGGTMPRRILIAVAATLVPLIAGCEAGNNAPTVNWHPPTAGTSATVGKITISNAFVLGAPAGDVLAAGQNAGVFLGLTNIGSADRLINVSAPGVAQSVRITGGQVPLRSEHAVLLTGPQPDVVLENLVRPLTGGSVITIRLTFQKAGTVKLQVPVMPRSQYYSTLLPAPAPSSASGSPLPKSSAGGTATPSPSASS